MIRNKSTRGPIEVDLTGPQGNAFVLLGMAKQWAKQLELNWEAIEQEATSDDYEHLVNTLDKYFGDYVTFLRDE